MASFLRELLPGDAGNGGDEEGIARNNCSQICSEFSKFLYHLQNAFFVFGPS